MDFVEKFQIQHKKRIMYSLIAMAFWIPALIINYYDLTFSILPLRTDYFALIIQSIGLVFIFLAYYQSFCPSCNKLAGSGWKIDKCKKCGVKLT
jgi:hypothetical protein